VLEALLPETVFTDNSKKKNTPEKIKTRSIGKREGSKTCGCVFDVLNAFTDQVCMTNNAEDLWKDVSTTKSEKGLENQHPKWRSVLPQSRHDGYLGKNSIFDVFKVPLPRKPDAFDADALDSYMEILEECLGGMKRSDLVSGTAGKKLDFEMKKDVEFWLGLDTPRVEIRLPLLSSVCMDFAESTNRNHLKRKLKFELLDQACNFRKELGWSACQYKYAVDALHDLAVLASKKRKALPFVIIWEKLKEAGSLKKRTIGSCLRDSASFSGGVLARNHNISLTLHSGSRLHAILDREDSKGEEKAALPIVNEGFRNYYAANISEQLAAANDILFEPTKQTVGIRFRRLISLGDADGALRLTEANMVRVRVLNPLHFDAHSHDFNAYSNRTSKLFC